MENQHENVFREKRDAALENSETVLSAKEKNKSVVWKKVLAFSLLLSCVMLPIFAAGNGTGIEEAVEKVTSFLSSGVITAVCLITLVVEAIGVVVMGKQGADIQAIISKFAPWVVGTVVLLSANGICSYFLTGLDFSS